MSVITLFIGFLAQLCFSGRILVQWFLSEKSKRVVSPVAFWILSLIGSYLLCLYGWLRDDFAIVFGQIISYYIYLWNLNIKNVWRRFPYLVRIICLFTPVVFIGYGLLHWNSLISVFFHQVDIPLWLIVFGTIGQILFTFRFVCQLIYSYRKQESVLPPSFWIFSMTGSTIIVIYGILRRDPVLIVGQSFGLVAYIRNLYIWYRVPKSKMMKQ